MDSAALEITGQNAAEQTEAQTSSRNDHRGERAIREQKTLAHSDVAQSGRLRIAESQDVRVLFSEIAPPRRRCVYSSRSLRRSPVLMARPADAMKISVAHSRGFDVSPVGGIGSSMGLS